MSVLKADATAADRLLKAAVRKARAVIAAGDDYDVTALPPDPTTGAPGYRHTFHVYDRDAVVTMLAEATRAADLLLEPREVSA